MAEDIPQSVVEAAWGAPNLDDMRAVITAALAEYERLGYRLVRNDQATVERMAQVEIGWSAFTKAPVVLGKQGAQAVLAALTAAQGGEDA